MVRIKFLCECGKKLSATEDQADRIGKCPRCGKKFRVPSADVFKQKLTESPPPAPVPEESAGPSILLTPEGVRLCPICMEEIEMESKRCTLCKSDLTSQNVMNIAADFLKPGRGGRTPFEKALKEGKSRMCPQCAEMIHPMARKCRYCKKEFKS